MVRILAALLLSVLVHLGVYTAATGVRSPAVEPSPRTLVDFQVAMPEPIVEAPEPELEAEPEPSLRTEPPPRVVHNARRTPEPPAAEKPAAAPAPVDLTGVTLTNTAGSGPFSAEAGSGESSPAPIRAGSGAPAIRAAAVALAAPTAPRIVAMTDLSRRPVPPNLDAALRRHYPENARRLGMEGQAVVRARIGPTGRVDRVRVVSSSDREFGVACERTLRGTQWSAPLDGSGRPVHTEIIYACRFRVDG